MTSSKAIRPLTQVCRCATRQQTRSYNSYTIRASIPSSQIQNQRSRRHQQQQQRCQSTEATAGAASPSSPRVASLLDQIASLTLLEAADLASAMKSRFNLPDISMSAPSAAAAGPAAAAAAPAVEEDEPAPAPAEKSLFTLKLQSFDAAAKSKIIKEVKSMLGLSLIDSKKFVESVPKVMKEGVTKEEGNKILETIKGLGGVVVME